MKAIGDEKPRSREALVSKEFPELIHYTSISALRGILLSNTLWATRATHLNDSTETELIWPRISPIVVDYYRTELKRLMLENAKVRNFVNDRGGLERIAESDGSRMVEILRSQMLGDDGRTTMAPLFVVSFSTHSGQNDRDEYHRHHGMLSQWRGYCGDDGVAIVFDTIGVENLMKIEYETFQHWPMTLSDVVYDSTELKLESQFLDLMESFRDFVCEFISMFVENRAEGLSPAELGITRVIEQIGVVVARLKHGAFHEERECRIVVGVTPELTNPRESLGTQAEKSFKTTHYRSSRQGTIPYIRLFEGCGHDLPIKRIIVGPSRNQRAHLETVVELTSGMGIEVTQSETPFVAAFSV